MSKLNRHDRRKASRDATPDEILPGSHEPADDVAGSYVRSVLDACREALPGYEFAFFMFETKPSEGRPLPKFNYGATCNRADMVAVLNAFAKKNEYLLRKLDELDNSRPGGTTH